MKDRLGAEIKPGDYIAYAAAAGRCSVLHIGHVLEIVIHPADYYYHEPYPKAKVELLECGFGDEPWSTRHTGKPKIVHIMFPERIVVIKDYIPKEKTS